MLTFILFRGMIGGLMEKRRIIKIILVILFGISILSRILGHTLLSENFSTFSTIIFLIIYTALNKHEAKQIGKLIIQVMMIPFCLLIYTAIFNAGNVYMLYGSMYLFFASGVCFMIISVIKHHRKRV
jgi:hypothetical protein